MITPYDLDIFKRNDDVKMKNTIQNKFGICEKYDELDDSELKKYCRKILDKETKKIFNKLNDLNNSKLNNAQLSKIKYELYENYTNRITHSEEAIKVIRNLLEFEDLIDFEIDINTIKNFKREYKNPYPLKMTQPELFKLVLLLMSDEMNKTNNNNIVNSFVKDLKKTNTTNVSSTNVSSTNTSSTNTFAKNIIKNILENYKGIKYWQLSIELAKQLDKKSDKNMTNLNKFFDITKRKENFVTPYVTKYISGESNEGDIKENKKKYKTLFW